MLTWELDRHRHSGQGTQSIDLGRDFARIEGHGVLETLENYVSRGTTSAEPAILYCTQDGVFGRLPKVR